MGIDLHWMTDTADQRLQAEVACLDPTNQLQDALQAEGKSIWDLNRLPAPEAAQLLRTLPANDQVSRAIAHCQQHPASVLVTF